MVPVVGTYWTPGLVRPPCQIGAHSTVGRPSDRSPLIVCGPTAGTRHHGAAEFVPAHVRQSALHRVPEQLLGSHGAQQTGLIVEVDGYTLDGRVAVRLVALEICHDLAHADDELVRNAVELDV